MAEQEFKEYNIPFIMTNIDSLKNFVRRAVKININIYEMEDIHHIIEHFNIITETVKHLEQLQNAIKESQKKINQDLKQGQDQNKNQHLPQQQQLNQQEQDLSQILSSKKQVQDPNKILEQAFSDSPVGTPPEMPPRPITPQQRESSELLDQLNFEITKKE